MLIELLRSSNATRRSLVAAIVATGSWATAPAFAQFVEPDVQVLQLFEGDQVADIFGWVAADLPDLDGDGVSEVIIPAIGFNNFTGRATVYSGRTGAVLADHVAPAGNLFGYSVSFAGDVNADGKPDYIVGGSPIRVYSGRDHSVLLDLTSPVEFGSAVSTAGDLNGDGYDDVVVGAQTNGSAFPNAGRIFAVSGKDGTLLWTRDGAAEGHLLGGSVGLIGDVNRDGVVDLSAGAWGAGPSGGGVAFVVSGRDGSTIHQLDPVDPSEAVVFSRFFASGAGRVNRDRVPDIFVGDYAEGTGARANTGRAYVFSGRTGDLVHVFTGFSAGDGLGPGRGIDDVNGDGRNDVVVAAYLNSDAAPGAGATYIFSGRSGALLRTITATIAGDNFGVDALSVGDVNGDRIPDYLVTAVGLSFSGVDNGRAYLIAGTRLPCVADLNGNGFVGPLDLRMVRDAFGQAGGPADLNGDGTVDTQDLAVAAKELGRCPSGVPRTRPGCPRGHEHCDDDDDDDDD